MLVVQVLATLFFSWEFWSDVLGLRRQPLPWEIYDLIQTFASVGLVFGSAAGFLLLRGSEKRIRRLGSQVDAAAGNYQSHLLTLFKDWDLTVSERAVAVYAMKGFSNAEIAELRKTTVSTVKSQMNAIFRKANLDSRQQLIAYLVEELLSGLVVGGDVPAAEPLKEGQPPPGSIPAPVPER